jgi:1-aminocyclopropane-1-carboxylate deaminase/D-cysteine desulfhydrase-like pyridoxal-dependent ACC family enzyme
MDKGERIHLSSLNSWERSVNGGGWPSATVIIKGALQHADTKSSERLVVTAAGTAAGTSAGTALRMSHTHKSSEFGRVACRQRRPDTASGILNG